MSEERIRKLEAELDRLGKGVVCFEKLDPETYPFVEERTYLCYINSPCNQIIPLKFYEISPYAPRGISHSKFCRVFVHVDDSRHASGYDNRVYQRKEIKFCLDIMVPGDENCWYENYKDRIN